MPPYGGESEAFMLGILLIFLILMISVVCHELGHYLAARRVGVLASDFSFGFGPTLFSKTLFGTTWSLRLLPLGGSNSFRPGEIKSLPARKRIFVFAAGPLANFLLGLVFFVLAGLLTGSSFVSSFLSYLKNVIFVIPDVLRSFASVFDPDQITIAESGAAISDTLSGLGITGTVYFILMLFYAMNLALLLINILPIPGLDGGQIALSLPELWHRPIDDKKKDRLNNIGLITVLVISAIYLFKDFALSILQMLR